MCLATMAIARYTRYIMACGQKHLCLIKHSQNLLGTLFWLLFQHLGEEWKLFSLRKLTMSTFVIDRMQHCCLIQLLDVLKHQQVVLRIGPNGGHEKFYRMGSYEKNGWINVDPTCRQISLAASFLSTSTMCYSRWRSGVLGRWKLGKTPQIFQDLSESAKSEDKKCKFCQTFCFFFQFH